MKTITLLVVFGLAFFSMVACQANGAAVDVPAPSPIPVGSSGDSGGVTFSTFSSGLGSVSYKLTGKAPDYEISVQTPAMQDSSAPHAGDFGRAVTAAIQTEVDAFKQGLLDLSPPPDSTGSYLDIKYELVSKTDRFFSIQFKISSYVQGAAHPNNRIVSFNYDLESGQELKLEQLFTPGSAYLQFISDFCKADLGKRQIGFDSQQTGADPVAENFQIWNVGDDGLRITFNEYQVAAYAAGPQVVVIPYTVLKPIFNPNVFLAPIIK